MSPTAVEMRLHHPNPKDLPRSLDGNELQLLTRIETLRTRFPGFVGIFVDHHAPADGEPRIISSVHPVFRDKKGKFHVLCENGFSAEASECTQFPMREIPRHGQTKTRIQEYSLLWGEGSFRESYIYREWTEDMIQNHLLAEDIMRQERYFIDEEQLAYMEKVLGEEWSDFVLQINIGLFRASHDFHGAR